MVVFRLGSSRYPANDGRGASLYGGRWNHKSIAVIYAAESRALCALEVLANADELANDYIVTPVTIPDQTVITRMPIEDLPVEWDAGEPVDGTRDIGSRWAKGLSTLNSRSRSSVGCYSAGVELHLKSQPSCFCYLSVFGAGTILFRRSVGESLAEEGLTSFEMHWDPSVRSLPWFVTPARQPKSAVRLTTSLPSVLRPFRSYTAPS